MAESALSLGYPNIAAVVARSALGLSHTSTDWTAGNTSDINEAIDKGYGDFLRAYNWSFLRQFATITTTTPYSTGTIAVTDGDATVTLTDGVFPSWAAQGTLYYDGTEYSISSRTDDTNIELTNEFSGTTASGESYALRRLAYDLPDDYGQPMSWFTYSSSQTRVPLKRIGTNDLLAMRTGHEITGYPKYAAIRPKTSSFDNTDGQRWEVLFYPASDGAYELGYTYAILAPTQLRTATPYPLGGQVHAQAIQDCCMAAARYLFRDTPIEEYKSAIQAAIRESILKDGELSQTVIGYNADRSDSSSTLWTNSGDKFVTYNGTLYD